MAKALSSSRIAVGVFGAPHGVRGEVRLKSYTGDPLAIATYAPLTDDSGERRFRIKSIRPIKDDMVVVAIEDVSDRNKAAALTRKEIFVTRDQLPPPDEDEFYHTDLIGLNAIDETGVAFGRVTALHNFGAGDLLELTLPQQRDTVLVPFTKANVPSIQFENETITVILPASVDGEEEPKA